MYQIGFLAFEIISVWDARYIEGLQGFSVGEEGEKGNLLLWRMLCKVIGLHCGVMSAQCDAVLSLRGLFLSVP